MMERIHPFFRYINIGAPPSEEMMIRPFGVVG
jgi:hypothetical protein